MQDLRLLAAGTLLCAACYTGADGPLIDVPPGSGEPGAADAGGSEGGDDEGTGGGEPGDSGGADESCPGTQAGPSRLRRLTRTAYNNAVRDLLGDTSRPADLFETDGLVAGTFASNVADVPSELAIENYQRAAEDLAATTDVQALVACDIEQNACADEMITTVGRRAWRRTLAAEEHDRLSNLWDSGQDAVEGYALVLQAILQSPNFLYQLEVGLPDLGDGDVVPLTQHELATRLSSFLWDSIPDDALLDAAEAGDLDSPAALRAEAERMLDDPKASNAIAAFQSQWLGLPDLPALAELGKDATAYPAWSDALREAMVTENALFVDHIVRGGGTLGDLLSSPIAFVDDALAAHYGVDVEAADIGVEDLPPGFTAVGLDPDLRPGLLTRAGTMSLLAKPNGTAPVHRGAFVRERLLCQHLESPPFSVDDPPEPDPNVPRREQYKQHSEEAACAGCHLLTDPVGFALENYDGTGALQTTLAGGEPIDVSGELIMTDVDGPFVGAAGLSEKLSTSGEVQSCAARTWFRFAFAAEEDEDRDACTIDALASELGEGASIRDLLLALIQSESFRHKRVG